MNKAIILLLILFLTVSINGEIIKPICDDEVCFYLSDAFKEGSTYHWGYDTHIVESFIANVRQRNTILRVYAVEE